jgi:hypothetical protein
MDKMKPELFIKVSGRGKTLECPEKNAGISFGLRKVDCRRKQTGADTAAANLFGSNEPVQMSIVGFGMIKIVCRPRWGRS